jgi:membrane-bound lytic murein transglycosylase D
MCIYSVSYALVNSLSVVSSLFRADYNDRTCQSVHAHALLTMVARHQQLAISAIQHAMTKKKWLIGCLLVYSGASYSSSADVSIHCHHDVFPCVSGLESAVQFWSQIYTELDTASGLIHDHRDLDKIYQVLYLNPHASLTAQNQIIAATLKRYQHVLHHLIHDESRDHASLDMLPEKRIVKTLWEDRLAHSAWHTADQRLRFQRGQFNRLQTGYKVYRRWRSQIESILKAYGLPPELSLLPFIESSYHVKARSKAGAAGIWQLMPTTAKEYLRVDDVVDERMDIVKSTHAAAKLLKKNYAVFKQWPLAITAYNHGVAGLQQAINDVGSQDLVTIIEQYRGKRFGFASRNFYAAFLAVINVMPQLERRFTQPQQASFVTVTTPAFLPAAAIAQGLNVDIKTLRDLNPQLHYAVWNQRQLIPAQVQLRLPTASQPRVQAAQHELEILSKHYGFDGPLPHRYYDVLFGDSLSEIALHHEMSIEDLVAVNHLTDAHAVQAGQLLHVALGTVPRPLGDQAAQLLPELLMSSLVDLKNPQSLQIKLPLHQYAWLCESAQQQQNNDFEQAPRHQPNPTTPCLKDDLKQLDSASDPDQEKITELFIDRTAYRVDDKHRITVQIAETLGHYALWLNVPIQTLRDLNGFSASDTLSLNQSLKLLFTEVSPARFEQQRLAFHYQRQQRYFQKHRIVAIYDYHVVEGDSLWSIALDHSQIPLWLLRQYNSEIAVNTVLPLGMVVRVPLLAKRMVN